MGKTQSKSVKTSGDPQVNVLNALDFHSEWHEGHNYKLDIILAITLTHMLISMWTIYKSHARKQAIKAAKSVAELRTI